MRVKHTLGKRCIALTLSLLLIAALLPSGAIALAANNSEILSFEQGNPVANISYKTGDTVNASDFPAELTAVIAVTPQSFTQVKPDDVGAYIAPENADALYEAGTPVVYSFAGANGTEYRVYGEADGVTGWYTCDAAGTITGKVQPVPITWDTAAVNTASAGTYTVTGTAGGYTLSCPAPEASVTVTAKSGDENIETHTITWISGAPEGTNLSLTPEKNEKTRAVYQLDFSKGGDEDIPAGQIEIRLPAHIFYGRDGKPVDTLNVPLAKAPAETGNTGFNYTIDEETGEIVIRNYKTIEASYHFTCQIGYDFYPYAVADGYTKSDIQANFTVKDSTGNLTENSEKLSISVHTETKQPETNKQVNQKYETWQTAWGETPADAGDYFYVEWKLNTTGKRGTQPFTLTLQENPGAYGEIIGWRNGDSSSAVFTRGDKAEFEKTIFYAEDPNSSYTAESYAQYTYVVLRYPRTMLETTKTVTNSYTASVNGLDGDTKTSTAERQYTYIPADLEYKGDYCRAAKGGGSSVNGGVNMLKSGKSVEDYFSLDVTLQGYGITNDGRDPYTTVLEDDLLFMDETRLPAGDYTLTGFYISNLAEYNYEIDPEKGYQAVLDPNYDSYQPITVWVKTLDAPDTWVKYGSVTRQSSGSFLWEGVDGSSGAVSASARISLPEGTAKVRFTHTGTRYRVSFGAVLYYKLHPTEHLLELLGNKTSFKIMNFDSAFATDKDGVIRTKSSGSTYNETYRGAIEESDKTQYGQGVSHYYAEDTYTSLKAYSGYTKKAGTPTSDVANSQETVQYTLTYYEYADYSRPLTRQDVVDMGVIHEQRDSVFYDLLPLGTVIDTDSIVATTYTGSRSGKNYRCDHTVEMITNWRNTGRTMVKIHVTAPENVTNFDSYQEKFKVRSGFVVTFTLINTWQNIGDYGTTVRNSSAYYSLNGPIPTGYADTGGHITDKEYFKDLDGDGNPPDALENVKYSECTTTFNPLIAAEVGFKKSVKASDELHYSTNSKVTAAGTYTYQLRFANSRNVNTGNVVMFDVLESAHGSNPYWQGTLQSINTSQPQMKGIAPVIYYSTYQGFTNLTVDGHQADLTDTTIWSTTAPENLADVTAIAIDLRHKADGTEYVFSPEEVALCYVTMTAPENYQDYVDNPMTDADETVYAYNSAYLQCTTTPVNGGASSTAVEECAPVTASMRAPEIEIHKSSDPQSGTEAQPTAVNVGDTVTYHISVKNKGTAEAIYNLSIEDVIPEGLSIQRDQLQYCFGSTAASPVTINGASRISVQQDGQKLVFSLDKLDAGETIHLLIPVTVSEDASVGMSFVNTAKLTAFNGKTWDIESETTYHKTESDFGYELPATGGIGTFPVMLCGVLLMVGCGFGFAVRQKKKRKSC